MYKFFFDSSGCTLSIILEYCAGGSLKDVVLKEGPIKPPKLYWLCYQILDALSYCHEKNIAHRDIKPANILIDSYGRPKLADFGLSKIIEKGESTTSCTGSRPYMAPEIINRQNADPFLADIWSLGVTFYAIALGHLPWCCHSGIELDVAINIGMLPFPSNIDPAFRELIRSMVVVDPTKRMSLANLMNLPIFDEFRNPNNTLNSPHKPFIRVPQGKGKTMIPQVRPFFGLKGYAANTKSYRPITKPFVTPQKPNIMQSPHQTFGNKLFPNKPLE
ncbi:CAMK family protein kinase [Histomonas meleagridis]|uniref:CAMK family protein kinase n=1 Tax=Histomonas meleagridis TaxID=135588 RepID=UPI003559BF22|nr:CAMK family protein kinase [Histomonas meleagridis]KAH0796377.1 CAMK family protein kinase [Histomonas meleagridis]